MTERREVRQAEKCLGIILAGGAGTRMAPMTTVVSKQLLPLYDKPTIYYPLTTLIEGGVRDVVLISQSWNLKLYESLLVAGTPFGMRIRVAEQNEPKGLAEAFPIAAEELGRKWHTYSRYCLILGDNIFHGGAGQCLWHSAQDDMDTADVFLTQVKDPQRYGVAEIENAGSFDGRVVSIEEKPQEPRSNWAVTGLYVYPQDVLAIANSLEPSPRGELEITDVNKEYLRRGSLRPTLLGQGDAWLDAGTPEAMLEAAQYVRAIQDRQGRMVGCPEEAAFRNGWINRDDLRDRSRRYPNDYGKYLAQLSAGP